MNKFCQSCCMPLNGEDGKDYYGNYCQYCTDDNGNLKSREEIQQGVAGWLKQLTPENNSADYQKRAEYFMKAMPAWAED